MKALMCDDLLYELLYRGDEGLRDFRTRIIPNEPAGEKGALFHHKGGLPGHCHLQADEPFSLHSVPRSPGSIR